MHKLVRQVRFSINPFLTDSVDGFNSYASKPCGEGLSIYFGFWVELVSELDGKTGFVVNVVDIDRAVRKYVVPIFREVLCSHFGKGKSVSLSGLADITRRSWGRIRDKFGPARLSRVSVDLNPFRKISIESEDSDLVCFSEKFDFAATHTLWNDEFSEERNLEVFGKCANPAGHGHNYVVEVTVELSTGEEEFCIGSFEQIVTNELIKVVDHKNLNVDVPAFAEKNPTVENISAFAWGKLSDKFQFAQLKCVTVWESDRTYSSYFG